MFAWGYPSRQRLDSIRLGGGLRLQADGDSRQLALTSQKYTLKSMILKDSPSVLVTGQPSYISGSRQTSDPVIADTIQG